MDNGPEICLGSVRPSIEPTINLYIPLVVFPTRLKTGIIIGSKCPRVRAHNGSSHGVFMKGNLPNHLNRIVFTLTLCIILSPIQAPGGQLYRWVDAEGTIHLTEDPSSIPHQFQDQVQKRNLESPGAFPSKMETQIMNADKREGGSRIGLKRFEIPYQGFEGTARRIIIPVTLNDSVTANLLIDTGAPYLVISPKLAKRLGLVGDKESGLQITAGGIGGTVPAMLAMVDSVKVGDAEAAFLPATITEIPSEEFEGLVGMDFMANYRISIDSSKSVITFDEQPAQQDRPGGHDEIWWRSNFRNITRLKSEWNSYLRALDSANLSWSETETRKKLGKSQFDEAEKLYRKLERFASDNAVPVNWRR